MTGTAHAVHLVPLASRLGDPVPLDRLDDPGVRENLDALLAQGITTTRVTDTHTARLAADVTPADVRADAVVVCTDTTEDGLPTDWVRRYRAETGDHAARVLFAGGSACANLGTGVEVAAGLLASGAAERVLLVTADRIASGPRHPRLSMTVFADGAASCLVTTVPGGPSFTVLGRATRSWPPPAAGAGHLAHARVLLTATRDAVAGLAAPEEITHLVTPNFGSATRELLAVAAKVPVARLHRGVAGEVGHCFAADTLLNLDHLSRRGTPADGDTVLALMSSDTTLTAVLLRYRA